MPANSQSVERAVDRLANTLTASLTKLHQATIEAGGGGRIAVERLVASLDALSDGYDELMRERDRLAAQNTDLQRQLDDALQRERARSMEVEIADMANTAQLAAPTPDRAPLTALSGLHDAYVRPVGGPDDSYALFVPDQGGWLTVSMSQSPELVVRRNTGEVPMIIFGATLAPEIYDMLHAVCRALAPLS